MTDDTVARIFNKLDAMTATINEISGDVKENGQKVQHVKETGTLQGKCLDKLKDRTRSLEVWRGSIVGALIFLSALMGYMAKYVR